ncbi:MFS general substrate transporter [Hesseltinella vesiculosa]|uniref:MFS general substrate transporter n=1 Tax=Hesseltinella vesiculosa TaxID=101127 RepID=A0A1X2GLW5_9FUNG|nr:MFS general substrate transporter [Hesseltinella vesiculosa]
MTTLPLWRVLLSTFCMIGIQFTWTVELGYGTPYLLSMNVSKEVTALVWLAGPLSGLLVQPVIGAISDRSHFRLGKRRPFIIGGSVLVLLSLVCIAYCKEIAGALVSAQRTPSWSIGIAIVAFYVLDFSLNAVQASCRSLILDTFQAQHQDVANAFASNMQNLTNVFGYFIGYLDLVRYLAFLGKTQMQGLCSIGIVVFVISMLVTCISTHETPGSPLDQQLQQRMPVRDIIRYIIRCIRNLPMSMQRLCQVQFFAWMGWFPFLFYSSTWVAGLYYQEHGRHDDSDWEQGTRAGSFALLMYAITSAIAGTVLPSLTYRGLVSLETIFGLSHVVFGASLIGAYWVRSVTAATVIISLLGVSWATAMWIPFALTSDYLKMQAKKDDGDRPDGLVIQDKTIGDNDTGATPRLGYGTSKPASPLSPNDSQGSRSGPSLPIPQSPPPVVTMDVGIALGILNTFIVLPQFVVAGIAALIFWIRHKTVVGGEASSDIDDVQGVAIVLCFGACCAFVAAGLSRRLVPRL